MVSDILAVTRVSSVIDFTKKWALIMHREMMNVSNCRQSQETVSQSYQSLCAHSRDSTDTDNSLVLTFDLQQNLPVPTLTHGALLYLRQQLRHLQL